MTKYDIRSIRDLPWRKINETRHTEKEKKLKNSKDISPQLRCQELYWTNWLVRNQNHRATTRKMTDEDIEHHINGKNKVLFTEYPDYQTVNAR